MTDSQRLEMSALQNKLSSKFVDAYNFNGYVDYNSDSRLTTSAIRWLSDWTSSYQTKTSFNHSEHEVTDTQPNHYKTTTESFLFENIYKIHEGVLTGAVESKSDKLSQPVSAYGTAFSGSRNQYAWSVGYGGNVGDHSYQLNARHDQDDLFGSKTTSAIAYGIKLTQQLKATTSISTGFRSPTLDQIYSSYGSLSLKPETSQNKDIGLQYKAQDSFLRAVIYRNEFKNLISSNPNTFVYYNVNVATLKGVTLAGNQKIGSYQFRGSYDILNAKDGENRALNLRAQHAATLGIDKTIHEWKFGAEWIGVGHRFDNAANITPLAAYALVNSVASYQINSDYKAVFRLNNLTDKKYQQIAGYATPGRNLYIGLNWQPK
jgi:vitamin B12 transporter